MSHRTMRRISLGFMALVAVALCAVSAASAASGPAKPEGAPKFTTMGSVAPQFLQNATTIEHWTFQYTDPSNGVTYPITMVGKDPRVGGASTIDTVIVALKMNFVSANQDTSVLNNLGYSGFTAPPLTHTFNADRRVSALLNSPIFASNTYPAETGGLTGQLSDTFMRAQFFEDAASNYHVNLHNTGVLHVTLDVPAAKGIAYQRPVGAWRNANGYPGTDTITGVADVGWFSSTLQQLMGSLHISATTVPIFLTDNVLLYQGQGQYQNCCILGYHGAGMPIGHGAGSAKGTGKQPVQTFIYGAWTTPGTYSGFLTDYTGVRTAPRPSRGLADIHGLSHEVSEWLDDPYVNNAVKPWSTPTAPQYGCQAILETGDPVVGAWFGLNGNNEGATDGYNYYGQYHPEDEVFAQWFGHGGVEPEVGSAYNGNLTFMGPLTTVGIGGPFTVFSNYSPGC
jgi:hypothetical protein